MGYKCQCGRYYINPFPTTCGKCGSVIPGGCPEGDSYKMILGNNKPRIIDSIQLGPECFVEFLDKWDDGDTSNVLKIRK